MAWAESEPQVVSSEHDPDTPAHIFAFRALRSLVFGERDLEERTADEQIDEAVMLKTPPKESNKRDIVLSPTKGILLTPGAGASRRKSVSFKNHSSRAHGTAIPFVLGDSKGSPSRTKTFVSQKTHIEPEDVENETKPEVSKEHDSTMPDNRSFWQQEFERYNTKSDREMRHIIRNAQMAKSFAAKKDREAMQWAARYRHEHHRAELLEQKLQLPLGQLALQQKVKSLEQENANLSQELADLKRRSNHKRDEEIISQVTRQSCRREPLTELRLAENVAPDHAMKLTEPIDIWCLSSSPPTQEPSESNQGPFTTGTLKRIDEPEGTQQPLRAEPEDELFDVSFPLPSFSAAEARIPEPFPLSTKSPRPALSPKREAAAKARLSRKLAMKQQHLHSL